MRARRLAAAVAVLACGAAFAADPERGFRGYLVVRGEKVLGQENARRLFTPGSVQKLLVSAAALHHLGADYRATTVISGAEARGGVAAGDLVVTAGGDPTWNARFFAEDPRVPLRALARQLAVRGLRRVTGDLVIDTSRFPGRGAPVSRPTSELAYAYAAPASALAVDESTVTVEIAPGRAVGDPGRLTPLAAAAAFEWVNRIRTVSRARHERGTVDFLPVWGSRRVMVRGEYPVSEPPYRVDVAAPHGNLHAAEILRGVLAEEGITVAGRTRVESAPRPAVPRHTVLAELRSPPLAEILEPILTESHNWYAEMLLRLLAAEIHGEGRDDEGLDLVGRFLTEQVGIGEDTFLLDDASGLSPYNLLSPEAVVKLLRYARRQPWRDSFTAALATPERGTLRGWGRLPSIAAKTGTIRNTLAIAGYLEVQGAEPAIFACFLNHRGEETGVLRAEAAAWLRDWARRR